MGAPSLISAVLSGSPRDLIACANSLMDVDPARVRAARPVKIEDATTVRVGGVYLVNCAMFEAKHVHPGFERFSGIEILIPLLGDLHEDPEIEPELGAHWHIDWRFIPSPMYEAFSNAAVHAEVTSRGFRPYNANLHLAIVVKASGASAEPSRKALVCWRAHAIYNRKALFLPLLERMYKSKRVCNNVCPHKGISLVGAPEDANGARTCPGHGLTWGRNGCLVRRAS
jgi:hypothetical protein